MGMIEASEVRISKVKGKTLYAVFVTREAAERGLKEQGEYDDICLSFEVKE